MLQNIENEKLLQAAKTNNIDQVKKLLDAPENEIKADAAYLNRGWSAIQWASKNGNLEMVKMLIKRGALKPFLDLDKDGKADGGKKY